MTISIRTRADVAENQARLKGGAVMRRKPAVQARVNWQTLGPAAAAALASMPPADGTAQRIISALDALPRPWGPWAGTALAPDPEVVALARSFDLAAEMVTTSRYRPDFTVEHAETAVSRLATAVGAISRVSAAAAACTEPSAARTHELASLDALTAASRVSPRTAQSPVPGLAPAPGSLPDAISRWCTTTHAGLQPREVDARMMHTVPADLQYIHAATTFILGAATINNTDLRLDVHRASEHLADAQTAWAETVRAWPLEARTQPVGRIDDEQLLATQRLHESIRDHLRSGPGWATPAVIAQRLDAPETLRAIADLGRHVTTTAQRYSEVTDTLLQGGQIAFPARRITKPGEQGLDLIKEVIDGAWIPLPATDRAAVNLSNAALGASLTTSSVEGALRHSRTGDFRDFKDGRTPPTQQRQGRRDDPRTDSSRITGPRL